MPSRNSSGRLGCRRRGNSHNYLFIIILILCNYYLQEFIYPEGISFPIGGTGQQQYIIMEMHYDNPNNVAGKIGTVKK